MKIRRLIIAWLLLFLAVLIIAGCGNDTNRRLHNSREAVSADLLGVQQPISRAILSRLNNGLLNTSKGTIVHPMLVIAYAIDNGSTTGYLGINVYWIANQPKANAIRIYTLDNKYSTIQLSHAAQKANERQAKRLVTFSADVIIDKTSQLGQDLLSKEKSHGLQVGLICGGQLCSNKVSLLWAMNGQLMNP